MILKGGDSQRMRFSKPAILRGGDFVASLFVGTPIMCVVIVFALCFAMWLFVCFLVCQSCRDMKKTAVVLSIVFLFLRICLFCLCLSVSSSKSCGWSIGKLRLNLRINPRMY